MLQRLAEENHRVFLGYHGGKCTGLRDCTHGRQGRVSFFEPFESSNIPTVYFVKNMCILTHGGAAMQAHGEGVGPHFMHTTSSY
jgi:hypothetical protein